MASENVGVTLRLFRNPETGLWNVNLDELKKHVDSSRTAEEKAEFKFEGNSGNDITSDMISSIITGSVLVSHMANLQGEPSARIMDYGATILGSALEIVEAAPELERLRAITGIIEMLNRQSVIAGTKSHITIHQAEGTGQGGNADNSDEDGDVSADDGSPRRLRPRRARDSAEEEARIEAQAATINEAGNSLRRNTITTMKTTAFSTSKITIGTQGFKNMAIAGPFGTTTDIIDENIAIILEKKEVDDAVRIYARTLVAGMFSKKASDDISAAFKTHLVRLPGLSAGEDLTPNDVFASIIQPLQQILALESQRGLGLLRMMLAAAQVEIECAKWVETLDCWANFKRPSAQQMRDRDNLISAMKATRACAGEIGKNRLGNALQRFVDSRVLSAFRIPSSSNLQVIQRSLRNLRKRGRIAAIVQRVLGRGMVLLLTTTAVQDVILLAEEEFFRDILVSMMGQMRQHLETINHNFLTTVILPLEAGGTPTCKMYVMAKEWDNNLNKEYPIPNNWVGLSSPADEEFIAGVREAARIYARDYGTPSESPAAFPQPPRA